MRQGGNEDKEGRVRGEGGNEHEEERVSEGENESETRRE